MMFTKDLHDGWFVRPVGETGHVPVAVREQPVPATVPGCVHTDLLAAGLVRDADIDRQDLEQTWIGWTDWRYTCRFDAPPALLAGGRVDLVCEGLDTVATVTLNDIEIGRSQNMHVACRFDARPALREGANELAITFGSPLAYAEAMRDRLGDLPTRGFGSNPPLPHNFIRKMACNFGWDWGPALVTSGIWRPIRFEAWAGARIEAVRPQVTAADAQQATLELRVDTEAAGGAAGEAVALDYELLDPAGQPVASGRFHDATAGRSAVTTVAIDRPRLWWPVGHGEQPLYTLRLALRDRAGQVAQRLVHRIGLRTVELVTTPDEQAWSEPVAGKQGARFDLKVNGKPIYCKGANWIPDDCFPHRVTAERYRRRVEQARDANMNMLRVWGGGLYESHAFYEACDELGVLVWQDFLFACACYSEEPPFPALIEAEARHNITRLARHPSLVIWNGCNENIWGTFDWGDEWRAIREKGERTWGLTYYLDLLPRLVAELDSSRPYWPGSPYSGSMDVHPNANEHGNRHIWDVWHGPGHYRNYLAHYPRMSTEFGFHGPPCWPTLARAIPADQRRWDSPAMAHHNKNSHDGQEQTHHRIGDDFHAPAPEGSFDDWLYLAQVMQARALDMGVGWFRALHPWNSGAVYWQLNDCWPVSSWSAIDGDGRLKPAWYATRRFFAPRLVTIKPRQVASTGDAVGLLAVYLHNDHDEAWEGEVQLRLVNLAGTTLRTTQQKVSVAPRAVWRRPVPDDWHDRPSETFLVADVGACRATWFFEPDKQLAYPQPRFDATLSRDGETYRFTITARTLLRDLCLFADRLDPDATVSEQCVTMLPGEAMTFTLRSKRPLTVEALTRSPVLQCANRFGAATRPATVGTNGSQRENRPTTSRAITTPS